MLHAPFLFFYLLRDLLFCSMFFFRISLCSMLLFIIFCAPCSRTINFLLPAPPPILWLAPCSFVSNRPCSLLGDYPNGGSIGTFLTMWKGGLRHWRGDQNFFHFVWAGDQDFFFTLVRGDQFFLTQSKGRHKNWKKLAVVVTNRHLPHPRTSLKGTLQSDYCIFNLYP